MFHRPSRTETILRHVRGPAILDVGCTGHQVHPKSPHWLHGRLRERFESVSGIDISEANVNALRALGYNRLYVQSAETFSLSERFDTIVAGELIEHLANPGLFLDRCRTHLKPDGQLVLTTPNPFSLLYSLYALLKFPRTCQNPQHTCWFCRSTLDELASRSGFRIAQFKLLEDYTLDSPSRPYRFFVHVSAFVRYILPQQIRNNDMLFVLTPIRP